MRYENMNDQTLIDSYQELYEQQINAENALRELKKVACQSTIDLAFSFHEVTTNLDAVIEILEYRELI